MKILNQRNIAWGNDFIGKSKAKIKDYGCTITCLAMLSDWFGKFRDPEWMANNLQFNEKGQLLWNSITESELNFKFVWRFYARDDKKIQKILFSKDGAVLLQVNNESHWVVAVGYSRIYGYRIADPYYGDIIYLNKRYPNITGFAEVTRK